MHASTMRPLIALTMAAALCGCEDKKMDMADMTAPPRPAELDRLNDFVGTWKGETKITMFNGKDQVMISEGVNHAEWCCDGRFMVEHFEGTFGEGQAMTGIGIWTWDEKAGKYRTWWFDSFGSASTGEAEYDEEDGEWELTGKGRNLITGDTTSGEGEIRVLGDNTLEYHFTEWDAWRLKKIMQMKGSSRRQTEPRQNAGDAHPGSSMTPE